MKVLEQSRVQDVPMRLEVHAGKGVAWSPYELGPPGEWEVEIAPIVSYISAGTELTSLRGMRDKEEGKCVSNPLGYSQCGIVTRVGSRVTGLQVGERVAAIGAGAWHATRTCVAHNVVAPVPSTVSSEVAALMAMLCFSLEGVYKADARIGQNIVVFGAGVMGQITARLFAMAGCRVAVLDKDRYRLSKLDDESVERFELTEQGWSALEQWAEPYGVEVATICFGGDASEVVLRLRGLMSHAPDGVPQGKIVFPGGATIHVPMAAHMGNLQLLSSSKAGPGYRDPVWERHGGYPEAYVGRTVRRNIEVLFELLAQKRLRGLDGIITHRFPFEEAAKAYELLDCGLEETLGVVLLYSRNE